MIESRKLLTTAQERLDPRHIALLVIDVQNDFAHPDEFTGGMFADLRSCEEIARIWQAAIERNKSPASAG